MMKLKFTLGFLLVLSVMARSASCQSSVLSGKVIDAEKAELLESVTISNRTSGKLTMSGKSGLFSIPVSMGDTVLFSSTGYGVSKVIITEQKSFISQNVYLYKREYSLPEVQVSGKKGYQLDSLELRKDYGKVFNYKDASAGNLALMAVFHPLSFIEYAYSGKKRKSTRNFQSTLVTFEQNKFIDQRYTPYLVHKVTGMTNEEEIKQFMLIYRPDYDFIKYAPEYDLHMYILNNYREYLTKPKPQIALDSIGVRH